MQTVAESKASLWTHLAVVPELSSFSEEEEVDEALKKALSVWLGLPAWPGLMGEDLSYSGVCFPSCGMLKVFCSTGALSTESRVRLRSTSGSGYECWTSERGKKQTCVILMELNHLQCFTESLSLTPDFTGSGTCGMLSIFGDGTAAGTPMCFGLTVERTENMSACGARRGWRRQI